MFWWTIKYFSGKMKLHFRYVKKHENTISGHSEMLRALQAVSLETIFCSVRLHVTKLFLERL